MVASRRTLSYCSSGRHGMPHGTDYNSSYGCALSCTTCHELSELNCSFGSSFALTSRGLGYYNRHEPIVVSRALSTIKPTLPARPLLTDCDRRWQQQVMPTVMSPKAAVVERLSQCIPPAMPPAGRESSFLRAYRDSPRRHSILGTPDGPGGAGGENGGSGDPGGATHPASASVSPGAAAVKDTEHLARTVPTSTAVIIYAFSAADQLVRGLAAAAGSSGSDGNGVAGIGGDSDDHRKCVLLRATATTTNSGGGGGASEDGDDPGGFGPALAAGLSRPVLAEEMGETHLWVVDSAGRRHLAAAFVSLQRATVFITLSASSQFPPFRVENRSSAETLAYRQVKGRVFFSSGVCGPIVASRRGFPRPPLSKNRGPWMNVRVLMPEWV